MLLLIKPWVYQYLLIKLGEAPQLSLEMGVRLGQISEFSLLIAVVAANANIITEPASYLIQAATLLTFIFSSYYIVMRYPTPIAASDRLRRD
jgi:predicted Kef-type K+ transport protein